jgi:hypothetical protein
VQPIPRLGDREAVAGGVEDHQDVGVLVVVLPGLAQPLDQVPDLGGGHVFHRGLGAEHDPSVSRPWQHQPGQCPPQPRHLEL